MTVNVGTLAANATATITINASLGVSCGAIINNTATITADNEVNGSNNSSMAIANVNSNCLTVTNTNDTG
ncbi:hypothetical protein, partial [Salmonella sp. SAL4443]|uniref:hypothetical protein n=1 Tax=Salmonella sp. SAL4443 TaxID=3159898 RepID=UPI00397AB089